jgi:hypothetical protein
VSISDSSRKTEFCVRRKFVGNKPARVAELADAQDLGSCPARGEGSTPSSRIWCILKDLRLFELVGRNSNWGGNGEAMAFEYSLRWHCFRNPLFTEPFELLSGANECVPQDIESCVSATLPQTGIKLLRWRLTGYKLSGAAAVPRPVAE